MHCSTHPLLSTALTATAAGLLAIGCAADAEDDAATATAVERADSAGVEIVSNSGPDRPLEWTVEPVLTLGGADEGPEAFFGVSSAGIDVDDDGNLYILDSGNHRVLIFDPEGNHLRTMGRQGSGPGEFEFGYRLAVAGDGSAAVHDFSKQGLVRYAPDGSAVEEWEVPGMNGDFELMEEGVIGVFGGGIGSAMSEEGPADSISRRLLLLDGLGEANPEDTTLIADLRMAQTADVSFPDCPIRLSGMSPLLEPELVWAAGEQEVAVNAGAQYVIDVYRGGAAARSIRRELPLRPVTTELAGIAAGDTMRISFGSGGCEIPPEDVAEARGFADVVPSIRRLAVAPDGMIWADRSMTGDSIAQIDVFGSDGEYLGTLPDGTPFPAAFRSAEELVAVEMDEYDLPSVVVYRIGRAGDWEPETAAR